MRDGHRRMNVRRRSTALTDDPLWYKDAIIYQLHVKSFFDCQQRRHRRLSPA